MMILSCIHVSMAQKQEMIDSFKSKANQSSTRIQEIRDSTFYLVEFDSKAYTKKNLAGSLQILRYLGNGVAIVYGLHAKDSIHYRSIHTVNDLWKLSRPLADFESVREEQNYYTLKLRYAIHSSDLERNFGRIKICHVRNTTVLVKCSFNDILKYILPLNQVIYVGLESRRATTESRVLDLNLSANNISYVHDTYPSLTGEGFTVSVKEDAYDENDIDLQNRSIPSSLASPFIDLHATEMATLIAGAGNSFITGKGVAKEVSLTSSSFAVLEPDSDADYTALGVSVQNHSYGTTIENVYGALAEAFDQSTLSNPTLLHVFSSGNDGLLASTVGAYAGLTGFANLTGNFKMAKNVLTVGSVDTVGRTIAFSSRGPAYDGRIKPDLVAYSTAGSSNSAAIVSGVAILVQHAYKEINGTLPSSDLIRAVLLNGAKDVGPPGIDFITGYGNVDAAASLQMIKTGKFLAGSVAENQTHTVDVAIPANTQNLRITLVWNDLPAQPNDAIALVNDLDLTLTTPAEVTILPWKLNASPSVEALTQAAVRGEDHLNTIEKITLEDVEPGVYKISVRGFSVQGSAQSFHIAYEWDEKEQFTWFFPTSSDNIPYNGETGTYFSWKSTLTETTGRLEYSIDEGASWLIIKDEVDLSKGLLRWEAPLITASAQARMVVGATAYQTDPFTISRPVVTSVGFNCTDSLLISWRRVPGAIAYEVTSFANSTLKDFSTVSDTSLIIYKSAIASDLFAIQPVLLGNIKTLRGYTFNYNDQGVSCYVASFFSELQPNEGIRLRLQLGSSYLVKAITFERLEGDAFISLATLEDPISVDTEFLDADPQQGLNTYQARVQFYNGAEIVTDPSSEYFLTEIPFLLFPNPVRNGEDIQIISKQFVEQNLQIDFYTYGGANVYTQSLFSDRESVTIPSLSPGLYVYTIATEEGISRGKIVVLP